MLNRIALIAAVATVGLAAAADSADAARFTAKGPSVGTGRHIGVARHVGIRHVGIRHVGINRHVGVARHAGIARHFTPIPGRHVRHGVGRLTVAGANAPCGKWICTWPTSGGGCLVWEKTLCRVINPF
jgi:hypothetical protein